MGANRSDRERLENMLAGTCETLATYYPDLLSRDARAWWAARKRAQFEARVRRSDAGVADQVLQVITSEEEITR